MNIKNIIKARFLAVLIVISLISNGIMSRQISWASEQTQATAFIGLTNAQVIAQVGPMFTESHRTSGLLASVSMAQFIVESYFGKSELAQNANNCFGMKTVLSGNTWPNSTWDGVSVYIKQTIEHRADGTEYTVTSSFRKYTSVEASIADHTAYLIGAMDGTKKRYEGIVGEENYQVALQIIKDGGYATDVNYVNKLSGVIEQYNLTQYDYIPEPNPIPTANPEPFNGVIGTNVEHIPLSLQGEGGYDPRTVSSNGDIAQRFVVPAGKALEEIKFPSLPTWSVPSNVDLILYSWNTDYATSVAGTVLATYHVESHTDNAPLAFKMNRPFPAGQYLVVMKQMPGYTCGVWVYSSNGDTTLFSGGTAVANESAFVEIGLANILDNVTIYSTYPHNHYNENHGNVNLTYTYDSNAEYQGPGVVNASLGAIGQKITVPRGEVLTYYAIHPIAAGGNFDYDVYKWNANYATTIAGPVLASRQLSNIPNGGGAELYFNNVYLPEGEYLILQRKTMEGYNIGPTSGGLNDNAVTFYDGGQVNWSIKAFYFTKAAANIDELPVESTYSLDFSQAVDCAKVTDSFGANVSQQNNLLRISFTEVGDTSVHIRMEDAKPYEVDISVYKYAAFKVKRSTGSSLGSQLYYNNAATGGADGSMVAIGSYLNTTRWQNVIYDLSNSTLPTEGIANYFRYDALATSRIGDVIEVESIRFFKTREAAEASFVQPIVGLYGDVNGDNLINVVDITLVSKHIAGNHIFDEDKEILADVNGDGDRDILDITLIAKYISEKIFVFPVEEM